MSKPKKSYGVGYGVPPTGSRFKKGQSGNPSGRPRGSKNLLTHLGETLAEKVPVREGDKVRMMSKGKAVTAKLVNSALKGELPAIRKVMELGPGVDAQEAAAPAVEEAELSEHEIEMLEAWLKRGKAGK